MTQRRLVLAEYHLTGEEAVIFFASAGHPQPDIIRVPFRYAELRELVTVLVGALDVAHVDDHALRTVDAVLEAPVLGRLIEPVLGRLDDDDDVYVVPHGLLHRLPLNAVRVSDGERLVDRHPVVYSPSASVLRYCRANRRTDRRTAVVVGDSSSGSALTFADAQAHQITQLFTTEVLSGPAASHAGLRKRFAAGSRPPALLHVNAHGVFDAAHPMRSGLELPGGRLTAQEMLELDLTGTFVTLAACSSGASATHPGDELLGLVRSLFYAGAPAMLATLWTVDELATAMMLGEFYRLLAEGTPAVAALWRSQRRLGECTAEDVITYIKTVQAGQPATSAAAVRLGTTLAHVLLTAGEYDAAARAADAVTSTADADCRRAAARLARDARLLSRTARPADRERRLYNHPFFWAPFLLIGDWY
ncbi:CHAT domain-containing protein [Streptomyces cacaoi]